MGERHRDPGGKMGRAQGTAACLVVLSLFFFLFCAVPDCAAEEHASGGGLQSETKQPIDGGSTPAAAKEKPADEYGNVTAEEAGAEGPHIADPVESWNRAMYHFNDKLYFWVLKPVTKVYKAALPEGLRGLMSNFYRNIEAPVRIVNNMLQGKPRYAGLELSRFLINSTVGVGGLRDCATDCFGIKGRDADFGQTLGKYGVGSGFYIVWPFLGPSSPRDTVGWAADRALTPTTYITTQWINLEVIGIYAHEKVNYLSFHLGDYEALKAAAVDPYISMRDAYVQYRKKALEE
jgi:phospholipid-binding lipoprotein MlaA